ncbi:MAG: alpha/beta hydrolase [Clostridiales bacterium]|nr:alpha/beta hydrolase [Clostridiales bacterium]
MYFGFSYIGLIYLAMLLIPNGIWTKHQPKGYAEYAAKENKILLAFERVGQFIVTPTAVLFSDFNFKGWNFWLVVLGISFLMMVLYDIAWVRYFRSEKSMKDFYRGFCGMPLALATYPVFAFLLLGIYGGNILMCVGSIILGIGHIGIHTQHAREVYGKKPKKKLPVRIILGTLKVVGILLLVAVFGFFIVAIAGRNANQIKRAWAYRNGVNEQVYVQLDGSEGFINVFGTSESNPVIISLHGGPGAPTSFIDYDWQDYLTDDYTIVSWDETGCGRSYYHNADVNPDNAGLTFEQQLADLDALVDYCCDRFGQDQVIILGHSYGSMLGSTYVMEHPEKISAYIGVGQCVNETDYYGEVYAYEDALRIAQEQGDDTSAMEAAYEDFMSDLSLEHLLTLRTYTTAYHPQTDMTDTATAAAIYSPILGVDDARWYLLEIEATMGDPLYMELQAPLEEAMMNFNLYDIGQYQVPVLFISGSCDWACPAELVENYANEHGLQYTAMEGCGHSPQGQHPDQFASIVEDFLNEC